MTLANVTDVVVLNIDSDVAVERVCPFCGQINSFKWDGNGELIWWPTEESCRHCKGAYNVGTSNEVEIHWGIF